MVCYSLIGLVISGGAVAGAEQRSRVSQAALNPLYGWMRAAEHASRGSCRVLERLHGLTKIVERGAVG